MRFHSLAVAAVLAACGSPSPEGPRFTSSDDHFSIAVVEGWTPKRDRGSLVLVGPKADGLERNTFAFVAVPVDGWTEERTPGLVFPATKRSLEGLPEARILGEQVIEVGDFSAIAYDVEFRPAGKREVYRRRHVVLIGDASDRLFHVIHTAPKKRFADSAQIFERVLETFREEG